jgi:putative ATPase
MDDMFTDECNHNTCDTSETPLAERLRPTTIEEFYGQDHLTNIGMPIRTAIDENKIHSMVLWGPPGTGKTTLAKLISSSLKIHLISLSAVMAGVGDIRNAVKKAQEIRATSGMPTLIFLDEIHRFNKSQQDAFLPYLEDGTIALIGATTENPSFQLNNALLSRLRVYVLNALDDCTIKKIINNALRNQFSENKNKFTIDDKSLNAITIMSGGDARHALNIIELVFAYLMSLKKIPK